MAQYLEDFSTKTLGSPPSGFTTRWNTTSVTYSVATEGTDRSASVSSTAAGRRLLSFDSVDADANRANVETLVKFKTTNALGSGLSTGLSAVRASGFNGTETGYRSYIELGYLRIAKYVNGTFTSLVGAAKTLSANTWYYSRFRVNGTSLYAKIWAVGDSEPAWDINGHTDSSVSAAGWVGISDFQNTTQPCYWDFISVATNGDTADLPGGATDIPCSIGSATSSGYSASVYSDTGITAGTGTATASGNTATVVNSSSVICGVGSATASGYAASVVVVSVVFDDEYERSNINIPASSIVQDSYQPTVTIFPRVQLSDNNPAYAQYVTFHTKLTGVNGKRPLFKVRVYQTPSTTLLQAFGLYTTQRFMYSYDRVTWTNFDTMSANADGLHYDFGLNTDFTADSVYVATIREFNVSHATAWVSSLASTYPDYVSMPPSSTGNGYVLGTMTAQTDERGRAIPSLPLYSMRITDDTQQPDDGSAKRVAVLMSGVHGSEDLGNLVLKGAVEYLLSADAKAVAARKNFVFYVYPMVNPSGRYGGHWRGDFNAVHPTYDSNRRWLPTPDMECITKTKSAIETDIAGRPVSVMFDFHMGSSIFFTYSAGTLYSAWKTKRDLYTPALFTAGAAPTYSASWWADTVLKAPLCPIIEVGIASPISDVNIAAHGSSAIKAVSDLVADGYFPVQVIATQATASASGYSASVTVPGQVEITCGTATASATGNQAALTFDATVYASVGAASATGNIASITSPVNITAAPGTATASGFASSISTFGITYVNCGRGLASASGLTANLYFEIVIDAQLATALAFGTTALVTGTFTDAPSGSGYLPRRNETQSRPAATQRDIR